MVAAGYTLSSPDKLRPSLAHLETLSLKLTGPLGESPPILQTCVESELRAKATRPGKSACTFSAPSDLKFLKGPLRILQNLLKCLNCFFK